MKTERQSSSGSEEGSSPRDDGDFVDVESESDLDGDDQQYEEYDVNTFLDSVLTGVGIDDGRIKRLGKGLRKACAEGNLIQLVRGVLHLVELYQAGKRSRSRTVAAERTAPSKNSKKRARLSLKSLEKRRRRHEGEVPQGRNTLVDLTEIGEEGNAETSADRSRSNQGQDGNEELEDLGSSIISNRGNRFQDENEEELHSEAEEGANNKEDANIFEDDQESVGESPSSLCALIIPEDESSIADSSRLDPSYREGARTLKRRRRNRIPFQKEKKTSENGPTDGEDSSSSSKRRNQNVSQKKKKASESKNVSNDGEDSSSSESDDSDVSQEEDSSSDDSSRNDQEEAEAGTLKRQKRGRRTVSEDTDEEDSSSSSDVSSRQEECSTKTIKATHKCAVCKKMWPSKSHLDIHSRVHTGERPFLCPHPNCGKTFTQRGHLVSHLRSHTGAKPYNCAYPRCKKAFATWGGLNDHKRFHTGERPFKCDHPSCFDDFPTKSSLRTHKNTHSEERPFRCGVRGCGKAYKRKHSLHRHQKTSRH